MTRLREDAMARQACPALLAFLKMKPRAGDAENTAIMTDPELRAKVIVQIEQFPAVALPSLEAPVVICGAVLGDDMAELWMVTGEGFERQLKVVLRQMRSLLETAREAFAPRALKLCVNPDRPGAERFVRRLGFTYEKRTATHIYTLKQKGT